MYLLGIVVRPPQTETSAVARCTSLGSAAVQMQQQMAGLPSEFSKHRSVRVVYDFAGLPTAPDHLDLDEVRRGLTFTPVVENGCSCKNAQEETDPRPLCVCKLPPLFIAFESVFAYGSEATVFKIHGTSVLAKICGPYEGNPRAVKHRWPGDWQSEFETECETYEAFPEHLFGTVVPRYFGSHRFGRGQGLILVEAWGNSLEQMGGFHGLPSMHDRCVVYDLFVRLTEAGFVTNRFRSRNVVRNDEGEYRLIDFGNMDNDDYNRDDRLARAMEDLNIYYEDYEAFKRGEL